MNESVEVANVSSALGGGAVFESELLVPLYVLIFVLAVVGNSLVVATLARNKRMRTVTNVYLLNLAISDLLLGVFCMPFTLVGQMLRNFIFGSVMCKLIPYFQAVSVSVAVWTLVAISLERYFAICRPLKSRRWQTQCHAYKVMGVVWILSLAASVPVLLASQLQAMRQPGRHKCREVWGSAAVERTYSLFVDVLLLLVPLLVMALAYSLVVSKLWRGLRREMLSNNKVSTGDERPKQSRDFLWHAVRRSQKPLSSADPVEDQAINIIDYRSGLRTSACTAHSKCRMSSRMAEGDESTPSYTFRRQAIRSNYALKSIEAKRKVIRMLFVVVAEFFICWAPLHVLNTWYVFSPNAVYTHVGRTGVSLVQLLAYVSCCCHPITYCFMNRKFRAAFIGVFAPCNVNRCSCCYQSTTSSPRLSPPCVVTPKSEGSVTLADIPEDSQVGIYRHRNMDSVENQ